MSDKTPGQFHFLLLMTKKSSLSQSYYILVFYVLIYVLSISGSGDIYLLFTDIINLDF